MKLLLSSIWKLTFNSIFSQVLICLSVLMIFTSSQMKPSQITQRYDKIRFFSKLQNAHDSMKLTSLQSNLSASTECLNFKNWTNNQTPKFQLDPNRFLIPVLYNGPNNQMLGFQQSIVMAILLNRFVTIVSIILSAKTLCSFFR